MKKILFLLMVIMAIGCGTRKTETSLLETKTQSETLVQAEKITDLKAQAGSSAVITNEKEVIAQSEEQCDTYTPIDPDKPMSIVDKDGNKKTIYNGKLETGNKRSGSRTKEKEISTKKDTAMSTTQMSGTYKNKAALKSSGKQKNKKTDCDYSMLPALLFAGMLVILFFYFILKRRTNENT